MKTNKSPTATSLSEEERVNSLDTSSLIDRFKWLNRHAGTRRELDQLELYRRVLRSRGTTES